MKQTVHVTNVLCGNVFEIDATWRHGAASGRAIRIHGGTSPALFDPKGRIARTRLILQILGSPVRIGRIYGVDDHGHLVCDVYHRGLPIGRGRDGWNPDEAGAPCDQCDPRFCRARNPRPAPAESFTGPGVEDFAPGFILGPN